MSTSCVRAVSLPLMAALLLLAALPRADAARRPGRTVRPGVWFLRVTNPQASHAKLCLRVYFNPNLDPWYGDTRYVTSGEQPKAPVKDEWLAPGQSSGWIDIGRHMSREPTFRQSGEYLAPVFLGALADPPQTALRLHVELATGSTKRVVRRIDVADPHPTLIGYRTWLGSGPKLPTLGLLVPVDPASKQRVWTLEEAAEQQLQWIASFGPTPKPSSHVWFISHQSQVAFTNPTRLERMQAEIVRRLGYANLVDYATDQADLEAMRRMGAEPLRTRVVQLSADPGKQAEDLKANGLWDYVRLVNFGDEISLDLRATPEEQNAAFVAEMKRRGLHAMDFVRPEDEARAAALPEDERWKLVRIQGALPASKPKLLYEAAVFRYRLWTRELAERTNEAQAALPPGTQTGANYSPHLSVWPDVRKWEDMFRDGGMTMPWSEDWWWQVPEASPESYGYLLDAMRHAADYHDAPSCFYTIPDNGESATDFLRMNYVALAHQAKVIDHFAIYDQAFGTCDYIDFLESKAKFRAIHRILSEVGRIDARLAAARMRPAHVGIMMSIANDVWDTEDLLTDPKRQSQSLYYADLNVDNHERKAIWLALTHAHIPVDLITDEDVAAGKLSHYKVLYVVGQEMLGAAVQPLCDWVKAGGILVGDGGGGLLNEYRERNDAMVALYGLDEKASNVLERPIRTLGPASDLPMMKPLDTATVSMLDLRIPAFCYRERLAPRKTADTLATFTDGSAAIIASPYGKGGAFLCGVLPGLAYLKPAMEKRRGLPETFPVALRELIAAPASAAGAPPVSTSDPLIEATLQEGKLGAVVTLVSFRNKPQAKVTVTLSGLPEVRRVVSLRHGALKVTRTSGVPSVTLPVDVGDFLLADP